MVAGRRQPAAVHALALAINEKLGNFGQTITFTSASTSASSSRSLRPLVEEMARGEVKTLVHAGRQSGIHAVRPIFSSRRI